MVTAYLIGIWSGDLYVRFALMIVAASVFVGYFAVAIWRGRHHAVRAFLATGAGGPEAPWGMRLLAQSWAALIIVYVVVMYLATDHRRLGGGSGQCGVLPGGRSRRGRGNTDCRLSGRPPHVPARPGRSAPDPRRRGRRTASSGGPAESSSSCSRLLLVLHLLGCRPRRQCARQARRVDRATGVRRRRDRARRLRLLGARHRRHQPQARGGNAPSMLTAQST